ncbi:MAG: signal peptide peptidase SppA [Ectothiorhodospiraceae bacterium]|nr:signal peptide peptidase SppA [Ectothiorhodospiraceae bacterium]
MTKSNKMVVTVLVSVAIALVIGVIIAALMVGSSITGSGGTYEEVTGTGSGEVALIRIENVIVDSEDAIRQLKKYRKRSDIGAIVLRVNSPGGGVVPSHEIYEEVRRTRDEGTPVVVSMGSVAASGGYYIACGATRIVANPGTITGSIGVISQFTDFEELFDKLGIGTKTIKSGKFKDIGNPTREMSEEEAATIQAMIDNIYSQFVRIVAKSRSLEEDSVRVLADGRVYSGEHARDLGLVDTLGTLHTAVMIAGSLAGYEDEPQIVQERQKQGFWDILIGESARESLEEWRTRLNQTRLVEYRFSL